jgi:Ca2+-binding EF-hand superfamily protein
MLDGPPALAPGAPCERSAFVRNYKNEDKNTRGYPAYSEKSLGDETNFFGSRGVQREVRAENLGKSFHERQGGQSLKSRSLNDPLHVHNQQRQADMVNITDIVLDGFRKSLVQRGGFSSVHSLIRIFRAMDNDGDRRLGLGDLKTGLNTFGISMDERCLRLLIGACDKRGNGSISYDDFLTTVRGSVSSSRRRVIDQAFRSLDRAGQGLSTLKDIQGSFSAKHYPDVAIGRLPEDAALANFAAQFDTLENNGSVGRDEFHSYYKNVSAVIDDDNYFEAMLRGLWRLKK